MGIERLSPAIILTNCWRKVLQKDIPTIQKKMATIIPEEKADLFEEPHDTSNQ